MEKKLNLGGGECAPSINAKVPTDLSTSLQSMPCQFISVAVDSLIKAHLVLESGQLRCAMLTSQVSLARVQGSVNQILYLFLEPTWSRTVTFGFVLVLIFGGCS